MSYAPERWQLVAMRPRSAVNITINACRQGEVAFLLATDVAARGLDILGVEGVVNFDAPAGLDGYLHRIGRTARAGEGGRALTFVEDGDRPLLKEVRNTLSRTSPHLPCAWLFRLVNAIAGHLCCLLVRVLRAPVQPGELPLALRLVDACAYPGVQCATGGEEDGGRAAQPHPRGAGGGGLGPAGRGAGAGGGGGDAGGARGARPPQGRAGSHEGMPRDAGPELLTPTVPRHPSSSLQWCYTLARRKLLAAYCAAYCVAASFWQPTVQPTVHHDKSSAKRGCRTYWLQLLR